MWKWPGPSGEAKQNWWESTNKILTSFFSAHPPPHTHPMYVLEFNTVMKWMEHRVPALCALPSVGSAKEGVMRAYRVPFALGFAGTLCEGSVSWSWLIWNYISQNPLFPRSQGNCRKKRSRSHSLQKCQWWNVEITWKVLKEVSLHSVFPVSASSADQKHPKFPTILLADHPQKQWCP